MTFFFIFLIFMTIRRHKFGYHYGARMYGLGALCILLSPLIGDLLILLSLFFCILGLFSELDNRKF